MQLLEKLVKWWERALFNLHLHTSETNSIATSMTCVYSEHRKHGDIPETSYSSSN